MNPTTQTSTAPQRVVNDVARPAPLPSLNIVDNIPVHSPGQPMAQHDDEAELEKIMQDVGKEMKKDLGTHKKHHFWELNRHHKKEANFSTQMTIKNVQHARTSDIHPRPAPPRPAAVAKPPVPQAKAPAPHTRVKPVAQKSQKQTKPPKPPKQHHMPVTATVLTILVTAALIAVAYRAYK